MEKTERLIAITKTVSMEVPADRVHIAVRSEGEGKTAKDAAKNENAVAEKFKAAVCGFDGVKAGLASVQFSRITRDGKAIGYKASRNCSLETDCNAEKLAGLTDAISDIGLNVNVTFSHEDASARSELIARAVKEARADAELIASAAGVKIVSLARAEYSSVHVRPMMMRAAVNGSFSDGYSEPQNVTLEETVVCGWTIE